ncbi:MAG: NYN domain-containing protein [Candidatus Pacebacteria bacterium]|nr:NYN domain-containing protein [Candidatus Paceibacterota bacterium]
MDLFEFKDKHFQEAYLFDPKEYGRIFSFVDFANVRNWAKVFWKKENKEYLKKEIDIEKIHKLINHIKASKKYFYYGHYKEHIDLPEEHTLNLKYRQSIFRIDKARKCGFRVRTKDIKEINNFDEDGKFLGKINKCNFDVEMTMDIIQQMEKYDTIFLWSGDSDFHTLLQYLKSKKKKAIVICARDFVSEELKMNCDKYIPADSLKDHLEYVKTNSPKR